LATTIEGFGQQAAQWHANFEDEDDPYGGRVSTLPDLAWPTEIGWDALGVASANEAFAFEMDVDQRKQRLASAFEFDGDVGLQLVPDDLLDVSIAAGVLADHIRAAHDIGRPNVVQPSGWDWRHYTQEALTLRAEEKRLRLEQSARRRARRRSTGKE
jgi:hypothetical protein